jgi:hypothetical protein
MSRNGQNSILFVATLGVYLGLVLVGATPQVAAQRAAMTRIFDIRDEIEFTDDLDKNPDGDHSELADPAGVYLQDVDQIIEALGRLDTATSRFDVGRSVFPPCEAFGQQRSCSNSLVDGSAAFGSDLKLDGKAFSTAIAVKKSPPASSSALLASLPSEFKFYNTADARVVRQKLIDATTSRSKGDQIFIVTRLPRASIDSLLSVDAK